MDIRNDRDSAVPHRFVDERGLLGFGVVGGMLLFVVLTGCAVWVLPFSVFGQLCVVLHTVVGVIAATALVVWQLSHWLEARKSPRTSRKICAYVGFWLLAASVVTGFIVSWQAVFGRYISHFWDLLHLWTGVFALPFLAYHVWPSARSLKTDSLSREALPPDYSRFRRRTWKLAAVVTVFLFAVCAALTAYSARTQRAESGRQKVGNSDFQPSMVDTETGRPIAAEVLASSDSCGTADCHASIYAEWKASAHRWSAEDEFFQEVRSVTIRVKGVHETEKCGVCHDPVSLLSGHKNPQLGRASPGYKEGDSCVVCHAVRKVDERGIGSYVLRAPKPYLFESATGRFGRIASHFLIRSYPDQHNRDYDLTLLRKPESCAPCHKEFDVLNEQEGPVQVETQYDDWKHGKWNTDPDPARRLYCQQCHMYLVATLHAQADPYDLKTELGARHRNHSFAAGNQYMPAALSVHEAKAHLERVNEWLRGERAVPEIEKTWPRGPIVELKIAAPQSARASSQVNLKVTLTNNKVGHGFPTGPLNIARAWIEVVVEDASGRTVFHSGMLDAQNHIEAGSYILKPLAIDSSGRMVMKPDLWHPVGPQFRRAVLAREPDTYDYSFKLPPGTQGPLLVKARLRYSKANQFFMDAVYADAHRQARITRSVLSPSPYRIATLTAALPGNKRHDTHRGEPHHTARPVTGLSFLMVLRSPLTKGQGRPCASSATWAAR